LYRDGLIFEKNELIFNMELLVPGFEVPDTSWRSGAVEGTRRRL